MPLRSPLWLLPLLTLTILASAEAQGEWMAPPGGVTIDLDDCRPVIMVAWHGENHHACGGCDGRTVVQVATRDGHNNQTCPPPANEPASVGVPDATPAPFATATR